MEKQNRHGRLFTRNVTYDLSVTHSRDLRKINTGKGMIAKALGLLGSGPGDHLSIKDQAYSC